MHQIINNIQNFLSMGGYGPFVWSSYGAMVAIFVINTVAPLKQSRRIKASLRSQS